MLTEKASEKSFHLHAIGDLEKTLRDSVKNAFQEKSSSYFHLHLTLKQREDFNDGSNKNLGRPKYPHICTIGDQARDIKTGDLVFDDYESLIKSTIDIISKANPKEYYDKSKISPPKDIGLRVFAWVGYRLSEGKSPNHPDLSISFTPIYTEQ